MSQDRRRPGRPWPAGAELVIAEYHMSDEDRRGALDPVFNRLRRSILYGDLEPGAWLRQVELAEHFNLSRTPVREALRALEREGLVRIVPHHGAQVAPLSIETFEEIYALRTGIEGLAARKAAESASPNDCRALLTQLAELSTVAREHSVKTYLKAEWALRIACYEVTGRTRLIGTIMRLREAAERYLRLAYRVDADVQDTFLFHSSFVDAICHHDSVAAEQINRDALQWTLDRAIPVIRIKVSPDASAAPGNEGFVED